MITKIHAIDRHKRTSTISVINREGEEIDLIAHVSDLHEYIKKLGKEDAVIFEASNGTFYWADQIEATGAECYIINPYKFKIIKESWKKTDKIDARNMVQALWVYIITGKFNLPLVYNPGKDIRELRKLFAEYQMLNKHQVTYKNYIQALLSDDGVVLKEEKKEMLFNPEQYETIINNLQITEATRMNLIINLKLLWVVLEAKEKIKETILYFGKIFEKEIDILLSIKGVSAFMALAFLADVGDVKRFKKVKQMNSYLGVVPGVKSSAGKTYNGHINRASRNLARSIFTQSIHHIIASNDYYEEKYKELKYRNGAGKSRIAFIRRIFGVMRRMLINEEKFKWFREDLYAKKKKDYKLVLSKWQGIEFLLNSKKIKLGA
jgi:transposase